MDCDHQVQIRFLRREALGLFTGRDNRVVGRDLLCIPDWTTKRGIGPGGDGFKSGDSGERGDDAGGILELLFGQIAAVGTRIRRQLLFIERLRGIQKPVVPSCQNVRRQLSGARRGNAEAVRLFSFSHV